MRRASGVASTSAREAVGLDACLQVCVPSLAVNHKAITGRLLVAMPCMELEVGG